MGRALSFDLRERVLKASMSGLSARKRAERFGVAASTAIRCIDRAAKGETAPRLRAKRPSQLSPHSGFVVAMIEARKVITLDEMVAQLAGERSLKIGRSALSAQRLAALARVHIQKRPHTHWSRNSRAC